MKRKTILFAFGFATTCCLVICGLSPHGLADESQMLKTFRVHRETFEQLREMMLSETSIEFVGNDYVAVGHKGVQRTDPDFPLEKYRTYRALMQRAEALAMKRDIEPPQEFNFLLDVAGFAGERLHTGVCWRDVPPEHLVSSFKSYRWPSQTYPSYSIYVHVDGNWYLWRD